MIRVGVPRALLYYQYYPMWRTFFQELGAEVVVSPPTTQAILDSGSSRVVADTCLPVKVFCGHVLPLVDDCDYIFVPSVRSIKHKVYNCSKFLGLPDLTRAVVPEAPPILEIDVDVNKGKPRLYQSIYRLGRNLDWNPVAVRRAGIHAWQAHLDFREMMSCRGLTAMQAIASIDDTAADELSLPPVNTRALPVTIAVVGHPYMLYDEHINHRLLWRLEQANCRVLTPEMITADELVAATARLVGRAQWTYEEEVVGAGGHYLETGVDGVIGVMAFGCGPDSLMMDMVRRRAAKLRVTPFMVLTLEEHTAEAGIVTRLEAFLDMIYRRKRAEVMACG